MKAEHAPEDVVKAGRACMGAEHIVGAWLPNIHESRVPEHIRGACSGNMAPEHA